MKKIFTLLCALLMVFALVGCKKADEPVVEEESVVVETPTQEVVEEPVVEEPTTAEILLDESISIDEKKAYCDSLIEGMTQEEKEQYLLELAGPDAELKEHPMGLIGVLVNDDSSVPDENIIQISLTSEFGVTNSCDSWKARYNELKAKYGW